MGCHSPIFAGNAFHFLKNTCRLPGAVVIGVAPRRSYYLLLKFGLPWVPRGSWMARVLSRRAQAVFGTIRPILDIGPEVAGALHGAILAIMLDKDVQIVDNLDGKISAFYRTWLEGVDGVELVE